LFWLHNFAEFGQRVFPGHLMSGTMPTRRQWRCWNTRARSWTLSKILKVGQIWGIIFA